MSKYALIWTVAAVAIAGILLAPSLRRLVQRAEARAIRRDVEQVLGLFDLGAQLEHEAHRSRGLVKAWLAKRYLAGSEGDYVTVTIWEQDDDGSTIRELPMFDLPAESARARVLMEISARMKGVVVKHVAYAGKPASATLAAVQRSAAMAHLPRLRRRFGTELVEAAVKERSAR